MTLELGGNIRLTGFDDCDPATMIVVKKMVGNFVRHIDSDDFSDFHITLHSVEGGHELDVAVECNGTHSATVAHSNLMMALDGVMKKVARNMQQ
jgi:ribosome-associated translation inhibitor RaiA